MNIPEYRVRLFLSVDLTGSTAFKHNKDNLEWIKAFQEFYGNFPRMLSDEFAKVSSESRGLSDEEKKNGTPRLWKTVGDEILFTCRLHSQCHLGAAIDAFIETLIKFGLTAKNYNLNTKGNAWVASFPSPNCSIMPIGVDDAFSGDSLNGSSDIPTEENEQKVDSRPNSFDFLGKGIDAGFRISKNSAIDTLTISPGLGILLSQAAGNHRVTGFKRELRLVEMQVFKGVANNSPYPVLTIDTSRDPKHREIIRLQRELLAQPQPPGYDVLEKYLTHFLEYHNIEVPKIKNSYSEDKFEPPQFYLDYCEKWEAAKNRILAEDKGIVEALNSNPDVQSLETATVSLTEVIADLPPQ